MDKKKKIFFIILLLFLLAIWITAVAMREKIEIAASAFRIIVKIPPEELKIDPKLYKKIIAMGEKYGLDVSFFSDAQRQLNIEGAAHPFEPKAVFASSENAGKFFDAIIFGDSTVYGCMSEPIISEITKKNIAYFAFLGAYPSKNYIKAVEELSKTYLKDNGKVFFVFADCHWGLDQHGLQRSSSMQSFAGEEITKRDALGAINSVLQLPQIALYDNIVSPILAPFKHKVALTKMHHDNSNKCIVYSITPKKILYPRLFIYCENPDNINLKEDFDYEYNKNAIQSNANMQQNLENFAYSDIPNKVLVLTWKFSPSLHFYAKQLSSKYTLVNLPEIMAHKYGCKAIQLEGVHVVNECVVEASVIFAKIVKEILGD